MKSVFASILALLFCVNLAFGLTNKEIESLYSQAKKSGISVKVAERTMLENGRYEQIVLLFSKNGREQKQVIFSDGEFLFPDVIDTKKGVSYQERFESMQRREFMEKSHARLKALLPQLEVVELGNDPKNPAIYLFTDPLCKYCREALKNYEQELKHVNFRVIFAPVDKHGAEALRKSVKILQECKKAKTDKEKLAIFAKYFDKNAPDVKADEAKVKRLEKLTEQIYLTGALGGVPTKIPAAFLE